MSEQESLRNMDYSVLQQCMHCGMCLPTCPTYDATHQEKNSPRGRIALMRAIADGKLDATKAFGEEMYFCLGCLACETACPAGVDYAHLFEVARNEVERAHVLDNPQRTAVRSLILDGLFTRPRLLRIVGRLLWFYRASGAQWLFRASKLNHALPQRLQNLEAQTPIARPYFSSDLIQPMEKPAQIRHRVGVLTGCVQDVVFSDINRDTVDVLLANGCEVHTPSVQVCCGSLHAHNGDLETAADVARRLIDTFDVENLDAIITNAAGCGSHLKTYGRLLANDPAYAAKAVAWSRKLKDIHEWLAEIGLRKPKLKTVREFKVTYHEACHLCHGQKITKQPREILRSVPGLTLVELPESMWCCGSAGIYNITQPEMAAQLQERKLRNIISTGVSMVATGNPGCLLQIMSGAQRAGHDLEVVHPITLLARAYRQEVAAAVPAAASSEQLS
jgi:glycolate oxidase iron-sulfur subunit